MRPNKQGLHRRRQAVDGRSGDARRQRGKAALVGHALHGRKVAPRDLRDGRGYPGPAAPPRGALGRARQARELDKQRAIIRRLRPVSVIYQACLGWQHRYPAPQAPYAVCLATPRAGRGFLQRACFGCFLYRAVPRGSSPKGGVVSDVLIDGNELVVRRRAAPWRLDRICWVGRARRPLRKRLQRLCCARERLLGESCATHGPQWNPTQHARECRSCEACRPHRRQCLTTEQMASAPRAAAAHASTFTQPAVLPGIHPFSLAWEPA